MTDEQAQITNLEKELAAARAELEELRKEYNEYCYVVSHDFSAPFRQIESFVELLDQRISDKLEDKERDYIQFVKKGARQCQDMINALLEYSRLNTLAQLFEPKVSLNDVMGDVTHRLAALLHDSKAKLELPELPEITGDKRQLEQFFYHLLRNAILYQPANHIPEVKLTIDEQPDFWIFTLQDNGIGIPAIFLNKAFVPLRRGTRDTNYPGQGMGLTIARKIIRRHGGDISLQSEEGVGTTVRFTLSKHL